MTTTGATATAADGPRRSDGYDWLFSDTALSGRLGLLILALSGIVLSAHPAQAIDATTLPQGGMVTAGSATIAQTTPANLSVDQQSGRAVIDWRSFDIGASAQVNFYQPSAGAIAVNRVTGSTDPSQILGTLTANGQVMILNPNGVLFGRGSKVDVAGLVASTGNIDDTAFMRGDTRLPLAGRVSGGSVINQGTITAQDSGLVALVAPSVANDGVINARLGRVSLAGASKVTLDLYGDQLIQIAVDGQAAAPLVANAGAINADGGHVALTAQAAKGYLDQVINMSGVVAAQSVSDQNGTIVLNGGSEGTVAVSGTLAAKDIETSGHQLAISDQAQIEPEAGGTWLIDPATLRIAASGGDVAPTTIVNALAAGNVTEQADQSITVADAIDSHTQSNSNRLALNAPTVNLDAAVTLASSQALTGTATTVNVQNGASLQNANDVAASGGATVNVGVGSYGAGVTINKAGLTMAGVAGAMIAVPDSAQINGININANNVTVSGFEIAGPVTSSYLTYNWGSNISRGVAVANGYTGFDITNNNIHDVRNGILIDGRNTGSVTDNRIENTKSGISVQYTDGSGITMSGNSEGSIGNEWGINLHLNGYWDGTTIHSNPISAAPTSAWQQALLSLSAANGGWSVQDQGYSSNNRTEANVATTGSSSAQGSALTPLNSIQNGVNAVVAGGTVKVAAGTYVESVSIAKALTLDGAGAGQSIVAPTSGDAVAVRGTIGSSANVVIDGFTFKNASNAGVSVSSNTVLNSLTVQNSDFLNDGKYGFTADGSAGAGIPGLTNVSLLGDTFEGNGTPYTSATSLGLSDIHFNYYNGNATLRDIQITGNTEHTGIHFRGYHDAVGGAVHNMGTVVLDNVTVGGSFRRPSGSAGTWNPSGPGDAIHIFEYGSVANVSFNDVVVTPVVGHGVYAEGLTSTLNLGNTRFGAPDAVITGTGTNPTRSFNIVAGSNDQNNVKTNVDATHVTFTGAADGFAIEDRVVHALDVSGLGLVTWQPHNFYVTASSGSIQRAIDLAASGDTIHLAAGTYIGNPDRDGKTLTFTGPGAPSVPPEDKLPPNTTITKAVPPQPPAPQTPPPAPPQAPPQQVAQQTVANVPAPVILSMIAPAAGGVPGGAPSAPQVVVTNNTSGVGGALAGGNAVVLDMSIGGGAFTQTANLVPPPPPPSAPGATPASTPSGGNGGTSTPQNQPGDTSGSNGSTQGQSGNQPGETPAGGTPNGSSSGNDSQQQN